MKTQSLSFLAHPDKGSVSALWHLPRNAVAAVVLGHGAGAGMTHPNMVGIASALSKKQIATLRYQFPFMERGGGRDSKDVSRTTVRNAVTCATKLAGQLPLFAAGHSFGGRMTSVTAAEAPLKNVKGIILCSYPLHASGKPSDLRAQHLPNIDVPMIFLSGTRDKMMTFELLEPTLKRIGARSTFKWLDAADHGYKTLKRSRVVAADVFSEMAKAIASWIALDCFRS